MSKKVVILGSTGSIGRSALNVIREDRDRYDVVCLAARSNIELLAEQIREFTPRHVAVGEDAAAQSLDAAFPDVDVSAGNGALTDAAAIDVDVVLCAVVGAVGLRPILCALDAGNRVALANKEPVVMAGPLITQRARARSP